MNAHYEETRPPDQARGKGVVALTSAR